LETPIDPPRPPPSLALIASSLAVVGVAAGLSLYALSDSIVFFYSPSEVEQKAAQPGARLRVGGLVKTGSVVKSEDQTVAFVVTDGAHDLKVAYQGLLPDLFREGQGVVAEGAGVARPDARRDHSRQA
jgi:cytochrome c-type biogenesis protein CcmE